MFIAAAGSLLLGSAAARAQDSGPLLDLLVKKGLINDQEAEEVRAELTKENAATSAGKLKLSTPVTELELYGDARLRYEVRSGKTGPPDTINPPGDTIQRDRARYRLRIGLRGTLVDDFLFGIRLETSTNPRSTNITFGDDDERERPILERHRPDQRWPGISRISWDSRPDSDGRKNGQPVRDFEHGLGPGHQSGRHRGAV